MKHPYLIGASFIGGEQVKDVSGYIDVRNPYTNEILGKVPSLEPEKIDNAISTAQDAFVEWSIVIHQSRKVSLSILEAIIKEKLGALISLESGKPLREGIAEVQYAASFFSGFLRGSTYLWTNSFLCSIKYRYSDS